MDLEDKDAIAVVDAKTMTVTAKYDLAGKGGTPAGLALDAKNHILFAACRNPAVMVMLNADDGKIITTLPIEAGTDGAGFNPNTMEAFSSAGNGTLTVIKENSPSSFVVEQVLQTMNGAKTMTIDSKTNRILVMAAVYEAPPAAAAHRLRTPLRWRTFLREAAEVGARGADGSRDSFSILAIGK